MPPGGTDRSGLTQFSRGTAFRRAYYPGRNRAFMRGLAAVFFFFFANLSFYLVVTMFMLKALNIPPLAAGLVFLPLALAFVIASRHSGARAKHRGTLVLIEGCALQVADLPCSPPPLLSTPHRQRWCSQGY